jgi:hypothetical protein
MSKFNNGKPYHGSEAVEGGKLRGATDTDYFYFFCPRCPDDQLLRILDFAVTRDEPDNRFNKELSPKAVRTFYIVFKIHCQNCGLTDFVKISNDGWQSGKHTEALRKSVA